MREQKRTQTALVKIDEICLPITIENLGDSVSPLFLAKCGYQYKKNVMTCAGLSNKKQLAIEKSLSEFCERVSLIYCTGDTKFSRQQLAPFLKRGEFSSNERCVIINRLNDMSEWYLPVSLFNPKSTTKRRVIDGTGFAAHPKKNQAIIHSLCEIYERHCVGQFWDNYPSSLIPIIGYKLPKWLKLYLAKYKLKLRVYYLATELKIPLTTCIAVLIDKTNHCYMGSACRLTIFKAIEAAYFEAILMHTNVQNVWSYSQKLKGRSKELFVSYKQSEEYLSFIESKVSAKAITASKLSQDRWTSLPVLIDSLKKNFGDIFYKDIGRIHNRYVVKYIIPRAYLRIPYGFACSKIEGATIGNRLPYPFG